MNTWQPIETAPLNRPVLVTDGKSVWFGQVKKDKRNAEDFPFFFGVSLQGDIFCQRPAFYFIEWQPAPDIFEKNFPEVAPDLIVAPDLTLNNVKILPNKHGMAFAFDPETLDTDNNVTTKTVDAVPVVHAHWWLEREPDGKPYCFHCSNCDADGHYIGIMTTYDYCPNCGAKMDEEVEL